MPTSSASAGVAPAPSSPPTPNGAVNEILELERTAARHWRGTEEEWLGGWLLRAAEGFTGRANSALPLADPNMPLDAAVAAVTSWYQVRGLTPMIAVPLPLGGSGASDRLDIYLAERKWVTRSSPAFVMAADLANVPPLPELSAGTAFRIDAVPDDAWLRMYHYRGQAEQPPIIRKLLLSAEFQAFVSIRSDGEAIAVGRLSIAEGWAGITAVEVDPAHRRRGLASALTQVICAEAATRGIRRAFLQVETANTAAQALYERCGFRYSHRYHYRVLER
jgi:ribosomal protein S18 acetylase RimI-like enzyme